MYLPQQFNFGPLEIPTMWAVSGFGVLYWAFILWYEGRKDGFDEENFFNLLFISLILVILSFIGVLKLYETLRIYYVTNVLLAYNDEIVLGFTCFIASLLPIFYFSKRLKWSKYRIFDIYSMGYCLFFVLVGVGEYLIYGSLRFLITSVILYFFYLRVLRYRGYKYTSGYLFSYFLFVVGVLGSFLYRASGSLLFYAFLFTIGLINLYFRRKKGMSNLNLPAELLKSLKEKLIKKEKTLENTQKTLVKEDPYLRPGRETDNGENMDDAIIEDYEKMVTDEELDLVKKLKLQVRRALAAMKLGRYGTCEVCGKPIDPARLKAYPEATTCLECSEKVASADNA